MMINTTQKQQEKIDSTRLELKQVNGSSYFTFQSRAAFMQHYFIYSVVVCAQEISLTIDSIKH